MDDQNRYDDQYRTQQANFDPTVMDNMYPQPTQGYPRQPPYAPPPAPVAPSYVPPSIANQPTVPPAPAQTVYVPYPVPARGGGDNLAITSLIFGIMSAAIGWLPVCGLMALFPAIAGIIFGGLGLKSRRRGVAIIGIVLSLLGVVAAFAVLL